MLVNEGVQTSNALERHYRERKMVEDGARVWRQQQENARIRKEHEQKQVRDMMDRYWPWGKHCEIKPRGLRNLRLEGLFPHRDYVQNKRFVGTLDMGRPGGGAPNVNETGRRVIKTKEDPMLRFQWSKDLRKAVDNSLRFKTNKEEQEAYKKDLDKLVEEKLKQREREKMENLRRDRELLLMSPPWGKPGPGGVLWRHPGHIGLNFLKSMGYTGSSLVKLEKERNLHRRKLDKGMEEFKRTTLRPPNQIIKNEKVVFPRKYLNDYNYTTKGPNQAILRRTQLSPLHDGKENGVELVPLMIERRGNLKIPLGTTDVTRQGFGSKAPKWVPEGPQYLQELSTQMTYKRRQLEETRMKEIEGAKQHFNTWESFWGRPGHGAPRSALRKGCIQKMLYPKFIAVAVS